MTPAAELVSVVMPVFNHVAFLEESLGSVAAQDHGSLELIVIDDASSDGSVERARSVLQDPGFAARFNGRVQLRVNPTSVGAHAAINQGLSLASGSVLAILNSDDCYAPGRLQQLVAAMRASGSELAFSLVRYVDESSQELGSGPEVSRLRQHQLRIGQFPSVGFACMCSNVAISSGNLVFTRSLHEAVGGFDDLRYCHDWDFLLRAVSLTEPIFVRRPLYHYRLHGANSFRLLDDAAEAETEVVLSRYFAAVRGGRLENRLAPSDAHWPGVFEYVMSQHGFWRYW